MQMASSELVPDWVPVLSQGAKILVIGSSGGIGLSLIRLLLKGNPVTIGLHYNTSRPVIESESEDHTMIYIQADLSEEKGCKRVVDEFVEKVGGIDALVVLTGGVSKSVHWSELDEDDWASDININLNVPFYLAKIGMQYMNQDGGSIVLMGTESALHGGSATSFPYGVAKRGVECLVQGLAREGARYGITVNGVRPGFIDSGFHKRWLDKSNEDLKDRINLIPLKRAGHPDEVAALILYLLSGWSQYITGQMFAITGGDWL